MQVFCRSSTLARRWVQVAVIAELLVLAGAVVVPRFHDLRPLAIALLSTTVLLYVAVLAMRVWLVRGPRSWRAILQVGAALKAIGFLPTLRPFSDDVRPIPVDVLCAAIARILRDHSPLGVLTGRQLWAADRERR